MFINKNTVYYANNLSLHLKKKIWLKQEYLNLTGSHKDRETLWLIKGAKKKNFKSIGCASTGNLGISLAFFSRILNIKCHVWVNKRSNKSDLIKSLGGKVYYKKKMSLVEMYNKSDNYFKKHAIFSANPCNSVKKYEANSIIIQELKPILNEIEVIVCCVNNGSHYLGLKNFIKKKKLNVKLVGVTSKSELANSIKPSTKIELNNKENKKILTVNKKDIIEGFELLWKSEKILVEGSSAACIGAIKKIKNKNICCILTGNGYKNLHEIQKILMSNKKNFSKILNF